jgi:hypothetical protein
MLTGVDALIAACARDHKETIRSLTAAEPQLNLRMGEQGGTLLAEFAGVGNLAGVRNLLDAGVSVTALYREGDGYFGVAKDSTALHVTAWRACPEVVRELIAAPRRSMPLTPRAAPRYSSPSKLAWTLTGPSFARPIPSAPCPELAVAAPAVPIQAIEPGSNGLC